MKTGGQKEKGKISNKPDELSKEEMLAKYYQVYICILHIECYVQSI